MLGTVLGTKDALMSKKDEAGVLIRGNSQSTTIVGLLCVCTFCNCRFNHLWIKNITKKKFQNVPKSKT